MGDQVISTYNQNVIDKIAKGFSEFKPMALSENQKLFNASQATTTYDTFKKLGDMDVDVTGFDDGVKEYFTQRANTIYDIKTLVETGKLDPVAAAKMTNTIEGELQSYSNIRGSLATTTMMFRNLGPNGNGGELSKLNNPEMQQLFHELYKDSGNVTLQNLNGKMALVGKGQVDDGKGGMKDWNYTLNLEEYASMLEKTGNAQGEGGNVVIEALNIDDPTFGVEALADQLKKLGGRFKLTPDKSKKDLNYYNVNDLVEYMNSASYTALDTMMNQGTSMASLYADWMPTEFGINGEITGGGMRDIDIDDPRYKEFKRLNSKGELSDEYKSAKKSLQEYILSNYFDRNMFVEETGVPGELKPLEGFEKTSNWLEDSGQANQEEVQTGTVYTEGLGEIIENYEFDANTAMFSIKEYIGEDAIASAMQNAIPGKSFDLVYNSDKMNDYYKATNQETKAVAGRFYIKTLNENLSKNEVNDFTMIPSDAEENPFRLMNYIYDQLKLSPEKTAFKKSMMNKRKDFVDEQMMSVESEFKLGEISKKERDDHEKMLKKLAAGI
jgi:hypothetical protein